MKDYIILLLSVCAVSFILKNLLPEGKIKKYALFSVSVILSVCIISPLAEIKDGSFEFNLKRSETEICENIITAAENTVRAVKGFENATATYANGVITVYPNNSKLFENAQMNINAQYVKSLLKELFKAEKVIIVGEINEDE